MRREQGFLILYSTDWRAPHMTAAEVPTLAEALEFCRHETGVLRMATDYKIAMGCLDVWDTRCNGRVPPQT